MNNLKIFLPVLLLMISPLIAQQKQLLNYNIMQPEENENKRINVGLTVGSPASISLVGSFSYKDFAVRISGFKWSNDWYGFQGDLSYTISRDRDLLQSISLVAGNFCFKVSELDDSQQNYVQNIYKQNYIGMTYDINYSGFFVQTGLGFGKGDFLKPTFLFQAGYLFAINY